MSEFKGKAGTIYTTKSNSVGADDPRWEAWLEDFCILGLGHTEHEALIDAKRHTTDIRNLIDQALIQVTRQRVESGGG